MSSPPAGEVTTSISNIPALLQVLIDRISRPFPAVILVGLTRQMHHFDFVSSHKMGSERYD